MEYRIFSLIDISEVRLKVSLETAPAERPQGVLGVWSPILSAVGNAFKIQVRFSLHLKFFSLVLKYYLSLFMEFDKHLFFPNTHTLTIAPYWSFLAQIS